MTSTTLFLLGGCTLGLIQFLAGVAAGCWLRRPAALQGQADLRRAQRLAANLQGLTQDLGKTVGEHQRTFAAVESRLTSEGGTDHLPTTDMIVGVVGEMLRANRQLQTELEETRRQVIVQSAEIDAYLTRSLTDPLTELPNRRALDEYLAKRAEEFRQQGSPFSLLMIDLDHFKPINDNFGHPMGDSVLRETSKALREAVRRQDFVARYGGEEFAAVLPGTDLASSQRAAEQTLAAFGTLSEKFHYLGRAVTASCGLASARPGESIESLVRRADEALYEAKRNGRNAAWQHDGESATWLCSGPPSLSQEEPEENPGESTEEADEVHLSQELENACQALRSALRKEIASRA